jgi:hypothetical protein
MANNSAKIPLSRFLDTWSRGPRVLPLLTNLGPVKGKGDAVDIPTTAAATVYTTEANGPETVSESLDTFTVDRVKFVNRAVTHKSATQLLNGQYVNGIVEPVLADLANACDRDVIEYLIKSIAGTSVDNHANLAHDALVTTDGPDLKKLLTEQSGVRSDMGCVVLASPSAVAAMSGLSVYTEVASMGAPGEVGVPMIRSFCGMPVIETSNVPGNTNPISAPVTASAISGGTWTVTVGTGHGFVVGQYIYTTGMTNNIAKGSAVAVATTSSTQITFASGSSTVADNGTSGYVWSASGMALAVYAPWAFWASDSMGKSPGMDSILMPDVSLVERTDAAGFAMKAICHLGRAAHAGSCKILHTLL